MQSEKCKYKKGTHRRCFQLTLNKELVFLKHPLQMKLFYRHKNIKGWFVVRKNAHCHFPSLQHRLIPYDFASSESIRYDYVRPP